MAGAQPFMTHILAPLDGSPLAEATLPFVEELARDGAGHVTLLHVTPPPEREHTAEGNGRLAESYLHEHRRRLLAAGIDAAVAITVGRPAAQIVRYAEQTAVDLVALATHGRSGIKFWTHGSVADEVIRTTTTPLLLVRPGDRWAAAPHRIQRLIVPLDGSGEAEAALAVAKRFALSGGRPVVLLRCVDPLPLGFAADANGVPYLDTRSILDEMMQDARGYLEGVAAELRAGGISVTTEVTVGGAADDIASRARSAPGSMIVLGTHGRSGWRRFLLGSVARRVLHTVPTPVVVCPLPRHGVHRQAGESTSEAPAASAG